VNKENFLFDLRKKLEALSSEEREAAITYYEEYFNDAGVENEQSVINELGSVEKIANGILKENNYPIIDNNLKEDKYINNDNNNNNVKIDYVSIALIILIFIILAPVIIPLFFAVLGIMIGLLFGGIGILITGLVVSVMGVVTLFLYPLDALFILGIGLVMFSSGILVTTFMVNLCAKGIPALVRFIVRIGKFPFQKGGINI
jgi:uncharacterized membrane protein